MKKLWTILHYPWKLITLLLLVILTFCYAMFQGDFVSWFLFFSFSPFALLSLAVSIYPMKDLEIERIIPKKEFHSGETLKVEIHLKRKLRFPLFYLVVEDVLFGKLHSLYPYKKSKKLMIPGFQKEWKFEYVVEALPRGEHHFQSIRMKTGDLLGLIEKEHTIDLVQQILVYPAYTEMMYRPFENQFDQGMTASRERVQRDTSISVGVREYQPGDRFSWINWKASAKKNEMMTKEFEQKQSHDVMVIMDGVRDAHFENIVAFTTSVVRAILKKGAQAGLIGYDRERFSFPIRGGEAQQQQLMYHLAKVEDRSPYSLDRVIELEGFITQQNASFILVTAKLTRELIDKASYLAKRKGTVFIFFIKNEAETLSSNEISLKALANARGVRVIIVHEGKFAHAFSEVNR